MWRNRSRQPAATLTPRVSSITSLYPPPMFRVQKRRIMELATRGATTDTPAGTTLNVAVSVSVAPDSALPPSPSEPATSHPTVMTPRIARPSSHTSVTAVQASSPQSPTETADSSPLASVSRPIPSKAKSKKTQYADDAVCYAIMAVDVAQDVTSVLTVVDVLAKILCCSKHWVSEVF